MVKNESKSIIRKRKRRSDFGKKRKAKKFTDKMAIPTKENFITSVSSTTSSITSNSNASKSPTPMLYSIITPQNPVSSTTSSITSNSNASKSPTPMLYSIITPQNPSKFITGYYLGVAGRYEEKTF
uniref:Uncharacterized protein n=1 Tax=Acrobeloides nanus TaxID=290746 RepID=A0A914DJP4_9BILA